MKCEECKGSGHEIQWEYKDGHPYVRRVSHCIVCKGRGRIAEATVKNTKIELQALLTEREGMIAENQHRMNCGNNVAYGDEAFQQLADKIRALQSKE